MGKYFKFSIGSNIQDQIQELKWKAIAKGWTAQQLYANTILAVPIKARSTIVPNLLTDQWEENVNTLNNNIEIYNRKICSTETLYNQFENSYIKPGEKVFEFANRLKILLRAARNNIRNKDMYFQILRKVI